jgi:hypothetical protein
MERRGALRALLAWTAAAAGVQGCGGGGGGFSIASIGSGGTGISDGIGSGVGSGGTGVQVSSTGPIEGFGSIIVNGIRFEIDDAQLQLEDVPGLKLGVTVQVYGVTAADGTARASLVTSAADLRGMAQAVNPAGGTFVVLGTTVRTHQETVFAGGLSTLADLRDGDPVQVHGLPDAQGMLLATRVERLAAQGSPVLVGTVEDLDATLQFFLLGTQRIGYAGAAIELPSGMLAPDMPVRVRATANADGTLQARSIEPWSQAAASTAEGAALSLAGLVSRFTGLSSFEVDGVQVDASGAKVSGGPASRIATGVRVEVTGLLRSGVLVADRVRIRDVQPPGSAPAGQPPGTAGQEPGAVASEDVVYSARGSVGAYRSAASFKVQGQDIDASQAVFVTGTAADLHPGRKVLVTGTRVVDDVLVADRVEFL